MEHIVIGVEHFELFGFLFHLVIHVVFYLSFAFLGTLGGDENYTVGTRGTVDRSRGGILQDVNTLDVVGWDIINTACHYTVNHIKWIVGLGDGTAATHADGHGRTWATIL